MLPCGLGQVGSGGVGRGHGISKSPLRKVASTGGPVLGGREGRLGRSRVVAAVRYIVAGAHGTAPHPLAGESVIVLCAVVRDGSDKMFRRDGLFLTRTLIGHVRLAIDVLSGLGGVESTRLIYIHLIAQMGARLGCKHGVGGISTLHHERGKQANKQEKKTLDGRASRQQLGGRARDKDLRARENLISLVA